MLTLDVIMLICLVCVRLLTAGLLKVKRVSRFPMAYGFENVQKIRIKWNHILARMNKEKKKRREFHGVECKVLNSPNFSCSKENGNNNNINGNSKELIDNNKM